MATPFALYGLTFVPAAVVAAKGHAIWLLAGLLFTPFVWWYAAFKLAFPGSWWERTRYGPEKRAAAHERYGERHAKSWLVGIGVAALILPFVAGFVAALIASW